MPQKAGLKLAEHNTIPKNQVPRSRRISSDFPWPHVPTTRTQLGMGRMRAYCPQMYPVTRAMDVLVNQHVAELNMQ